MDLILKKIAQYMQHHPSEKSSFFPYNMQYTCKRIICICSQNVYFYHFPRTMYYNHTIFENGILKKYFMHIISMT